MPFTLAHPAIVIPLRKTGLGFSLTGLIIGSMAPDLEYFIQMREVENIGHQWYGILLFDVPIAICLSFLFHNVLRNSFVANLPQVYRKRFLHLQRFNWNSYAMENKWSILLSICVGVMSHLAWDAFTHHDGLVVEWIPALAVEINMVQRSMPIYFLLQIVSSMLGMVMVHLQIMRMPVLPSGRTSQRTDYRYWMVFSLFFFTIASLRLVLWPECNSFGGIMIAIMGSFLYSWLPVSILFSNKLSLQKIEL